VTQLIERIKATPRRSGVTTFAFRPSGVSRGAAAARSNSTAFGEDESGSETRARACRYGGRHGRQRGRVDAAPTSRLNLDNSRAGYSITSSARGGIDGGMERAERSEAKATFAARVRW